MLFHNSLHVYFILKITQFYTNLPSVVLHIRPALLYPPPKGGRTIVSRADPAGVNVGMTLYCLHNIVWRSCWILTKFSWIYNRDITINWLNFGDLDLIFKATAVDKLKIHGEGTSVFSENTITSNQILVFHLLVLRFFFFCGQYSLGQ